MTVFIVGEDGVRDNWILIWGGTCMSLRPARAPDNPWVYGLI